MFRLPLAAIGLLLSTHAAAEDWRLLSVDGAAPARVAGMIDFDSIDRSKPGLRTFDMGLLLEQTDEDGISRGITTHVIDCTARTIKIVHVEVRGADGHVLDAQAVTTEEFEPI